MRVSGVKPSSSSSFNTSGSWTPELFSISARAASAAAAARIFSISSLSFRRKYSSSRECSRSPNKFFSVIPLSYRHQVELLVVQLGVRPQRDVAAERMLQVLEHRALFVAQRPCDIRVDAQHQALAVEVGADLLHLCQDLVADRRA